MALTRNSQGLVVLGVEAKVDETIRPNVGRKKAKATQNQMDRIAYLRSELGGMILSGTFGINYFIVLSLRY